MEELLENTNYYYLNIILYYLLSFVESRAILRLSLIQQDSISTQMDKIDNN